MKPRLLALAMMVALGCTPPVLLRRWNAKERGGTITAPLKAMWPGQYLPPEPQQVRVMEYLAARQCDGDFDVVEEGMMATGDVASTGAAWAGSTDPNSAVVWGGNQQVRIQVYYWNFVCR